MPPRKSDLQIRLLLHRSPDWIASSATTPRRIREGISFAGQNPGGAGTRPPAPPLFPSASPSSGGRVRVPADPRHPPGVVPPSVTASLPVSLPRRTGGQLPRRRLQRCRFPPLLVPRRRRPHRALRVALDLSVPKADDCVALNLSVSVPDRTTSWRTALASTSSPRRRCSGSGSHRRVIAGSLLIAPKRLGCFRPAKLRC